MIQLSLIASEQLSERNIAIGGLMRWNQRALARLLNQRALVDEYDQGLFAYAFGVAIVVQSF